MDDLLYFEGIMIILMSLRMNRSLYFAVRIKIMILLNLRKY